MMSAEKIKELRNHRSQFIKKLYEMTEGSTSRIIHMESVGKELGFDREYSFQLGSYLNGENLLENVTVGGGVQLTHYGVQEVEEAIANPNEPTEHFAPFNIINIGTMTNSQIQQATTNSTQSQIIDQTKISELQEILQKISDSLERLELQVTDKEDLKTEIETMTAQLKSSSPKKSIISECIGTMTRTLGNAASSTLVSELIDALNSISL